MGVRSSKKNVLAIILTVEKAQQEPHFPWFFTSVTMPLVRQSTVSAKVAATSESSLTKVAVESVLLDDLYPFIVDDTSLVSCVENYIKLCHALT